MENEMIKKKSNTSFGKLILADEQSQPVFSYFLKRFQKRQTWTTNRRGRGTSKFYAWARVQRY